MAKNDSNGVGGAHKRNNNNGIVVWQSVKVITERSIESLPDGTRHRGEEEAKTDWYRANPDHRENPA